MENLSKLDCVILSEKTIKEGSHRSPYAGIMRDHFLDQYYNPSHRTAIYRMDYFTGFMSIYSPDDAITYLYGPYFAMSAETVEQTDLMDRYHIRPHERRSFTEFFDSYPKLSSPLAVQVFAQLYEKHLGISIALEHIDIIDYNNEGQRKLLKYHSAALIETDIGNKGKSYHTAGEIFKQQQTICSLIRQGDEPGLRHFLAGTYLPMYQGLCDSHLVNQRNSAIGSIALAVQAAIEGGLAAEMAYRILDYYYLIISGETKIDAIYSYSANALFELARNVSACQYSPELPPVILQTLRYIQAHIDTKLTVAGISERMHVNPTYLSRLFSESMQQSLGDYILKRKVEKAKELLRLTDQTLSEIADLLCFSSQAHFQKVFKKYAGITPKYYRDHTGSL